MLTAARILSTTCLACDADLYYSGTGRKPVYCSPECERAFRTTPEYRADEAERKRWERALNRARKHFAAKYPNGMPGADAWAALLAFDADDRALFRELLRIAPEEIAGSAYRVPTTLDGPATAAADAGTIDKRDMSCTREDDDTDEDYGFIHGADLKEDDWRYGPNLAASRRAGFHVTLTKQAETDPALAWIASRPTDDGELDKWLEHHYYDEGRGL